jgi:eukaryotic-like serine/threonine-protein kinase
VNPERFRQVEDLYHAAREDRAALDQADPELRREVESLLARDGVSLPSLPKPLDDSTVTQIVIGTQLGPYRIEALLGAGGMGQVYRAVDTRLDRKVAIKISARQFSDRFEREARAISALNHPHICTLHDVGPNYLVMELVEGETLKGPLPLDRALKYAVQICDALDVAHKKGITHCDLKPGNIMVTRNGVKVLDFGLAKSQQDQTLTATNAIMGTPKYMAPEQKEGKECDARTDIYALGLVLREMATDFPPHVAHVIDRCLAKEPEDRWQSARDLKAELEWAPPVPPQAKARPTWPWIAVAALAVLAATVGWWRATGPAPLGPLVSVSVDLPDEMPLTGSGVVALSPDGARLALALRGADGKVRLHTRRLDRNQLTPLAETENASSPFFSPDGEWIGFFADGKIKKISVEGGAAVALCDANLRGASWGDDGDIIAALNPTGGLSRIPSAGGTPTPVTKLNPGEATHRWPQVLPGSQAVLFSVSPNGANFDDAAIDAVSLKTGERKTLQRGAVSAPRYLATSNGTGYLTYLRGNTLFAVPFDPRRLALAGVPTPILEDVGSSFAGAEFAFAGAPSGPGTLVYLAQKRQAGWLISWLDGAGKMEPLHAPPANYFTLRFSPDGKRLAFSTPSAQRQDIWVKALDQDTPSRLSFLEGQNLWPVWTPDGKYIVFESRRQPTPGLYWIRSDGSGEPQRLTDGKLNESPYSFSPDGKRLAFDQDENSGSSDLFTAAIEGDGSRPRLGKPEPFLETPFDERYPAFSPDGHWLAYQSNETKIREIYVRPFPGPGGKWQISTSGGILPVWSRAGHELLFESLDGHVMAVSYTTNRDSFAASKPRLWSEARLVNINFLTNYDLAPDGRRLAALVDKASTEKPPTHLTVLLNFSDELRRRTPAGGK